MPRSGLGRLGNMERPGLLVDSCKLVQGECVFAKLGILLGAGSVVCLEPTQSSYILSTDAPEAPYKFRAFHQADCRLCLGQLIDRTKVVKLVTIALTETQDGFFLLCRNALRKTLYPRHWVVPGGHVEGGETLNEAVVRELREETYIDATGAEAEPICLLQKCFINSEGSSLAHFLIVPFHIRLPLPRQDVDLRLDPLEVDSAVWLSLSMLEDIWQGKAGATIAQLSEGGTTDFSYSQMQAINPAGLGEGTAESAHEAFRMLMGR